MDVDWDALRAAAVEAMHRAYAPYSRFPVGVAGLVDDGRVITGCNVENASYGVGLCAECGLVSALHLSGGGRLVAVSCVDGDGVPLMPCGRCRQLLWEHGGPRCLVETATGPVSMAELLPYAFDAGDLGRSRQVAEPAPETIPSRLLEFVGHGAVFVHRDVAGGQPVWTAYWERAAHADEASGILQEAPTWSDAAAAVAWGRARTSRVIVVEADGTLSWAGVGTPPAEVAREWRP
ncbi:cytidine deaminase [Planosporangium flavigriseum]|uniref:cytidine deaminase n=1 Tax=Planosporangium flavigriseum TaxID=373681 RepID=UPI00143C3434|nr:cytidine deaminase [Planosporangium flavigriseum]NJC63505.1 cytidine deaminase [Planosporangium flavigriseum]